MRYDIVEEILDDDLERRVRGTEHVELGSRKGKWGRLNIPKNLAAFVGIWHDSGRTFFMSAMKDSGEMNAGTRMSGRILGSHTNLRKVIWDSLLEPGLTSVKCSHARIHPQSRKHDASQLRRRLLFTGTGRALGISFFLHSFLFGQREGRASL